MPIECYFNTCPDHMDGTPGSEGPFCDEQECKRTPAEIKLLTKDLSDTISGKLVPMRFFPPAAANGAGDD